MPNRPAEARPSAVMRPLRRRGAGGVVARTEHHFVGGFADLEGFLERRVELRRAEIEAKERFGERVTHIEEEVVTHLGRFGGEAIVEFIA